MDSSMPMMLPKGIVINTKNIYKEVADFPVVPPDKVWEYWHVYTTTYKKLKDPTACRLENFWWHVWGSDRRFLKGSALAKLYEDISLGPTFVPLKGPPNRWEGPDIPPLIKQILEAAEAEATPPLPLPQPQGSRHTKSTDSVLRTLSSSASKPPPAHPILKKARGPSSSGPRPTARFVSPHESADEDEIPSSGSTAATASEAPVYVVSSPKKKTSIPPAQKLAPSAAVVNKKMVPPKRLTATSVEPSSREGGSGSSNGTRNAPVSRPVPSNVDTSLEHDQPASGDSHGVSHEHPVMSEKARGKQPMVPVRPVSYRNEVSKENVRSSPPNDRPRSIHREKGVLPQARSLINLASHGSRRGSGASSKSNFGVGSPESDKSGSHLAPPMSRSHSHGGYDQPKPQHNLRAPGLFTEATSSTSNVAVTGMILDQSGFGSSPVTGFVDHRPPQHHTIPVVPPKPSVLDARFTPTQPTTSASLPLGRTKSQLTLLLEREKARSGGSKPRSKS
ncbi:hypothetical protein BHE90_008531 [Fusarium euwallaceae]|uniref:Nitrogen regulatory protein areA GATA-like domain-containing protein n=2 Tax=Fusarium solani species complex TaxID=232080 RepID=A0A3M2RPY3_9HYPO|nr:hypothetical protein CDV36_013125 [Fusarium kuroshium]RTE77012.1 hypothetical protein BHE90_008531 [Fusarium euwallaceae]